MIVKRLIITVLCFALYALTIFAQTSETKVNADPNKAKFVTSDINNFWRAVDLAAKETEKSKKIAIY